MSNQNNYRQCPHCNSFELPTARFCSQCGVNFQQSIFNGVNKKQEPNWKLLTGIAAVFLIVLLSVFAAVLQTRNHTRTAPLASLPETSKPSAEISPELIASFAESEAAVIEGKVIGVSDGDTVTVLDQNNKQHKIRLGGIDAPEASQDFGEKSKQNLSALIFGKTVKVIPGKTDKYGRTVGKILLDGRDVNLEQIKAGMAWHYKEYASEQIESDRSLYADAEIKAKEAKAGLWITPNQIAPWNFRKGSVNPADANKIFGNKNSFIYHWAGCPGFTKISVKNRVVFASADEAEAAGYRAAKNCSTPSPKSGAEKNDEIEKSVEAENIEKSDTDLIAAPPPRRRQTPENSPRPVYEPPPSTVYVPQTRSAPKTSSSGGYIRGPRGGCYYINRNGNKTYVDRSLCN